MKQIFIYCDASKTTIRDVSVTCSYAYCPEFNMNQYKINIDSTNNYGELFAGILAINIIVNIKMYNPALYDCEFIIISDSEQLVKGLNIWIDGWVRKMDEDGNMKSTSGPVKNQETYKALIAQMLMFGIYPKIWHVKGHVHLNNPNEITNAYKYFIKSNNLCVGTESAQVFKDAVVYNNHVDKISREILKNTSVMPYCNNNPYAMHYVVPYNFREILNNV